MASDAAVVDEGARAVELIDAVLARRPEKDDAGLAAAAEAICAYRQDMIVRRDRQEWSAADERSLGTLNGILSMVLAAHFPLGEVRWPELGTARAALAELIRRAGAG